MDAAPKLEVFLGQHQCSGEPGVDCRTAVTVRLGAARKGESSRCERVNMYSYSRCQTSSFALPHQPSQSPRHNQYEICGLSRTIAAGQINPIISSTTRILQILHQGSTFPFRH